MITGQRRTFCTRSVKTTALKSVRNHLIVGLKPNYHGKLNHKPTPSSRTRLVQQPIIATHLDVEIQCKVDGEGTRRVI